MTNTSEATKIALIVMFFLFVVLPIVWCIWADLRERNGK